MYCVRTALMDLNSACQRWYNAGIDHYIWEFPGNMESFSFWLPHPARASLAELHTDSTDCLTRLQCIMVWFERICDFWYLGAATLIAQAGLFKEMAEHTDRASNSTAGVVITSRHGYLSRIIRINMRTAHKKAWKLEDDCPLFSLISDWNIPSLGSCRCAVLKQLNLT